MSDLPAFLKQGERARLFPTVADTNRENRLTSIFLALLPHIPALSEDLFLSLGVRVGKRTKIRCWTEVVPLESKHIDKRPDGLIQVTTGKTSWTALIEAKIKGNTLSAEQVAKYLETARSSGIDAVLTISNEFVARSDHSPVEVPKNLLRKTGLFHWSWTWIQTQCEILSYKEAIQDTEQAFLLDEFLRLLSHKDTGVERFTSMGRSWKDLIVTVSNNGKLKKSDPAVEEGVGCWLQEERDLSLHLSRHVGARVETVIERRLAADAGIRLKAGVISLVEDQVLESTFRIPDAAADLGVSADLLRRTLSFSMKLKAPVDRKSTKARVNWVLRMIPGDDPRLLLRAHWPGRTPPTQVPISKLRENPELLQTDNNTAAPHSFEVLMVDDLGGDFSGTRKFIERLEDDIVIYYDLVGQHLRAWQPPPPKPVKPRSPETQQETAEAILTESESSEGSPP